MTSKRAPIFPYPFLDLDNFFTFLLTHQPSLIHEKNNGTPWINDLFNQEGAHRLCRVPFIATSIIFIIIHFIIELKTISSRHIGFLCLQNPNKLNKMIFSKLSVFLSFKNVDCYSVTHPPKFEHSLDLRICTEKWAHPNT